MPSPDNAQEIPHPKEIREILQTKVSGLTVEAREVYSEVMENYPLPKLAVDVDTLPMETRVAAIEHLKTLIEHRFKLVRIITLNINLFASLDAAQQALYERIAEHVEKNFPLPRKCAPADEEMQLISLVHCFLVYEQILDLISRQPDHVGRSPDRPLRVCDLACGYGYLVPLFDMICKEKGLFYEVVLVDKDDDHLAEAHLRYDRLEDISIKIIQADAANLAAFKAAGIDPLVLFDLMLLQHPQTSTENPNRAAFAAMFNEVMPAIGSANAFCHVSTYTAIEMQMLLEMHCAASDQNKVYPYEFLSPRPDGCLRELPEQLDRVPRLREKLLQTGKESYANSAIPEIELLFRAHQLSFPYIERGHAGISLEITPSCVQLSSPVVQPKAAFREKAVNSFKQGYYADAAYAFEMLLKFKDADTNATLHFNLGRCFIKLRQFDKAQGSLEEAVKHCDDDSRAYYEACILECEALALFDAGIYLAAHPKLIEAHEALINAGKKPARCQDVGEAIKACEENQRSQEIAAQRVIAAPAVENAASGSGPAIVTKYS